MVSDINCPHPRKIQNVPTFLSHFLLLITFSFNFAQAQDFGNDDFSESPNTDSKIIVGGDPLPYESGYAESLVLLSRRFSDKKGGHGIEYCSGVLIRRNIVLTAAHCVPQRESELDIIFGGTLKNYLRQKSGQNQNVDIFHASKIVPYSDYATFAASAEVTEESFGYDVALVKLSAPAPDDYTPIAVEESFKDVSEISKFLLMGFGVTEKNVNGVPYYKVQKPENLVTYEAKSRIVIFDQNDGGICEGDSGGPLFALGDSQEPHLIGINVGNSNVKGKKLCRDQGYFLNLNVVRPWIMNTLESL